MAKKKIDPYAPRKVPKLQKYKCKICLQEYDNETFAVDNEKDCPVCDNRDCAVKI